VDGYLALQRAAELAVNGRFASCPRTAPPPLLGLDLSTVELFLEVVQYRIAFWCSGSRKQKTVQIRMTLCSRVFPPLRGGRLRHSILGEFRMDVGKLLFVAVFLTCATLAAPPAHSQTTATNCIASQQSAVRCFVANAVATDLTKPRYGMTLAEFQSYGYAVAEILQTHQTYVVLVGVSSAVADAMPPTNADGSANQTAQDNAVTQTVAAANSFGFTAPPTGTSLIDLEHFSLDITSAMNDNNRVLELLTPGISLRIIDSYVVTATTNGQVNWSEVNSSLSTAIGNFVSSGLIKIPPGMALEKVTSFANSLAQVIYNYKIATHRTFLSPN
jgi:hypothetical protein